MDAGGMEVGVLLVASYYPNHGTNRFWNVFGQSKSSCPVCTCSGMCLVNSCVFLSCSEHTQTSSRFDAFDARRSIRLRRPCLPRCTSGRTVLLRAGSGGSGRLSWSGFDAICHTHLLTHLDPPGPGCPGWTSTHGSGRKRLPDRAPRKRRVLGGSTKRLCIDTSWKVLVSKV